MGILARLSAGGAFGISLNSCSFSIAEKAVPCRGINVLLRMVFAFMCCDSGIFNGSELLPSRLDR